MKHCMGQWKVRDLISIIHVKAIKHLEGCGGVRNDRKTHVGVKKDQVLFNMIMFCTCYLGQSPKYVHKCPSVLLMEIRND